ncbi:unnamed protein product [Mytilus coruscus]|uniref:Uncharacterized protein n=1 Tax=Mytilus coruscus TaxID=42192 RepID=A0A6J8AB13_MYTCO|nr:unnamed protein product [Mytilus coruscus]
MAVVFTICVCICYAVSCASSIGSPLESSLQFSKYHFEEKVLEKLVRPELKMEMYESKIKTWEDLIPINLDKIDHARKQTDTFLESMRIILQQEQIRLNDSFKETVDNVYLKSEREIKRILDSISTKIGEFENRSENALALLQDSLLQEQERFNHSFHETVAYMYIQSGSKVKGVLDSISSKMNEIIESHGKRENAMELLQSSFLQDQERFNQSFHLMRDKVERESNKTVQNFISEQKDISIIILFLSSN